MNPRVRLARRTVLLLTLAGAFSVANPARAYLLRIGNGYHAQVTTYFCGPASIQMMLDSPAARPNLHPLAGNQFAIHQVVRANNIAPGWASDPVGLRAGVDAFDLNPAHTYVVRQRPDANRGNRDIANSIVDSRIPASSLINRGAHWIDVYGVYSSAQPVVNQPYAIYGFFIRDPWPAFGSIGSARYLANNSRGWLRYFNPVNPRHPGPWGNRYVAVTDPPADDDGLYDSFPAPPPTGVRLTAAEAAARAALELAEVPELTDEFGFSVMDGFFSAADAQFLQWYDDGAEQGEWLLPFIDPAAPVGQNITGTVLLDAYTGEISQSSWIMQGDDPVSLAEVFGIYSSEYAGNFVLNSGGFVPESPLPGALVVALLLSLLLWHSRSSVAVRR